MLVLTFPKCTNRPKVLSAGSKEAPIISFTKFTELLRIEKDIEHDGQVVDALHFLANNGELCFFRENSEQVRLDLYNIAWIAPCLFDVY